MKKRKPKENLTGRRFGRLLVIGRWHDGVRWACRCECGRYACVRTVNLLAGKSRSCGCLLIESFRGAVARASDRALAVDLLVREHLDLWDDL